MAFKLLLLFVLGAFAPAAAQDQGAGARFPDVAQVKTDYADDAEQFIAFDILFNRLSEAKRGKQSRADYELSDAYLRARGEVLDKYEQAGRGSDVYTAFTTRSGSLFSNPSFKRSVYERYGLVDVPAGEPASGGPTGFVLFPERIGDTSDAEIWSAFYEAFPIWGGSILAMAGLTWVLMRSAGDTVVKVPPGVDPPAGLPPLPESLRAVSVGGRRYDVMMAAGQVIDKQSSGRPSAMDQLWVRTPEGRETSLTVPGAVFQTRPGHIVSTILRPLPDGASDVLLAYDHTTDQLGMFQGLYAAHATRFLLPFVIVAFVGSIPGAFGLGLLFHRLGGLPGRLVTQLLALWIMGGFVSTIIAVVVGVRTKPKVEARRTASFVGDYAPEYRRFLAESTPALTRHFAGI